MTDRELFRQALEALELLAKYENPLTKIQVRKPRDGGPIVTMYPHKVATDAAAPLRERLAQPEQEPVAWMYVNMDGECEQIEYLEGEPMPDDPSIKPLYTTPPRCPNCASLEAQNTELDAKLAGREWVGLTEEQRDAARWRFLVDNSFDKEGVTQFHVWEHSWEPHSQTGKPTEWKQRVRGPALDRFIDRAIAAKLREKNA